MPGSSTGNKRKDEKGDDEPRKKVFSSSSGHFYRIKRDQKKKQSNELLNRMHKMTTFFASGLASESKVENAKLKVVAQPLTSPSENLSIVSLSHTIPDDEDNTIQMKVTEESGECKDGSTESLCYPVEDLQAADYMNPDPGMWNVTATLIDYWCKKGVAACQNREHDGVYAASRIKCGNEYRSFTNNMTKRELLNGEIVQRDWLIYSPSQGKMYCFQCKLFSMDVTQLSRNGCCDWKHAESRLSSHENSTEHARAMAVWNNRRLKTSGGYIDAAMEKQYQDGRNYWMAVLKRIVEVIKFLAERGLAFFGQNQEIGSPSNGNYLGVLELISKFDPFLANHLAKHGNKGSGHTSYLSSDICTEFISLMGTEVRKRIINIIIDAKYYSFSVDSSPDVSHIDQLVVIFRYVDPYGEPVERFLTFLANVGHSGAQLSEAALTFMSENGIEISNCRGQTYDNASAMCGKYNGMQAHVKEKNPLVELVPCAAHSLNLVGEHAASSCALAVNYFSMVQQIYVFFSASSYRWSILTTCLATLDGTLVPKKLSDTRWSARYDATRALMKGYTKIYMALKELYIDKEQKATTHAEALGIMKQMESVEMVMLSFLWNDILERFQPVSKILQSVDIDLSRAVQLLSSLTLYLEDIRNRFEAYEQTAKKIAVNPLYKEESRRTRKHYKTVYDGNASEAVLKPADKFRINTFLPILDKLQTELQDRIKVYELLEDRFACLHKFKSMGMGEIKEKAEALVKKYPKDLSLNIVNEINHLTYFVTEDCFTDKNPLTARSLLKYIINSAMVSIFPNVVIGLRIFLCLFCSNCTGERSFSKLKHIKSHMRSTMLQEKMIALSVMSIESDILRELDFNDIISDFAHAKTRKHIF